MGIGMAGWIGIAGMRGIAGISPMTAAPSSTKALCPSVEEPKSAGIGRLLPTGVKALARPGDEPASGGGPCGVTMAGYGRIGGAMAMAGGGALACSAAWAGMV